MRLRYPALLVAIALTAATAACAPASNPTPTTVQATAAPPTVAPMTVLSGVVTAPTKVVVAGGGSIIAAGAGNIVSAAGNLLSPGGGNLVGAGAGNLVGAGAGNLVGAGAGNLVGAGAGNLVGAGAGNLVGAGAGNLVSPGGGNLVSPGGGNLVGAGAGNLVGAGAGNLVGAGAGNLVGAGAGNLVGAGAGNLVQFGAHLVGAGAGNLVGAGAGNLVGAGAGNLVGAGAGNLVGAGAGNYELAAAPSRRLQALEMAPIPSTPVVGGRVIVNDAAGNAVDVPPTYTDADGRYTLPPLPSDKQYIITVIVGDESAALSARTYGLAQASPTPRPGGGYYRLQNPMLIGIALPDGLQTPGPTPTATGAAPSSTPGPTAQPTARPTVDPSTRDDLYLKTIAAADKPQVRADITLATTVILEALVLSTGSNREAIKPDLWQQAVERLTPLLREIDPATVPDELLSQPVVDALEEPLEARAILEGWTVLRPEIIQPLQEIAKELLGPVAVPTVGPSREPEPTTAPETYGENGAANDHYDEPLDTTITFGSGAGGSGGSTPSPEELVPPGGYQDTVATPVVSF